jgi:hypothetical protein
MLEPNLVYQIPYEKMPSNPDAPLAPLVNLTLKNPELSILRSQKCLGIIDTGSDITLIPRAVVTLLKLRRSGKFRLYQPPEGAANDIVADTTHLVQLSFDGINFFWADVWRRLGSENLIIIGRDVLNNDFIVKFDGVNFITTIECYLTFE